MHHRVATTSFRSFVIRHIVNICACLHACRVSRANENEMHLITYTYSYIFFANNNYEKCFFYNYFGSCVRSIYNLFFICVQGPQPVAGQIKYKSTMKSIVLVAREEGVAALYKGLLPKVMRLGPGGAIMMLVYEYVYEYLEHKLS